ncbi:hypothetical protein LTS10_008486 [Elasticomyces elasticus]|nr:hypothetical protein LTS10_008486 [Elasticomyces elasticus]
MGDWFEANTCCVKARIIWSTVLSWHPFDVDLEIDKRIEELLADIEELRLALDQADDNPGNYDFDAHVSQGVASHEAAVEQAREGMYVEDPAELEEADSMELNIPVEELRKLDPKKSHVKPPQIAEPGDAPTDELSDSGGRDRPPFMASQEMGMAVRPRVGLGEYEAAKRTHSRLRGVCGGRYSESQTSRKSSLSRLPSRLEGVYWAAKAVYAAGTVTSERSRSRTSPMIRLATRQDSELRSD